MRTRALLALGACAMLALTGVSAQQPTFRSSANLVEVTVIVRDANGNFVPDLTVDDFEITEDGKPQRVQTLYVARAPGTNVTAASSGAPDASGARAAERAFLFLFDMPHLSPGSLTKAREAVRKFSTERLQASDLSGMAAIGGTVQGRITSDHRLLADDVSRLKPRGDGLARDREFKVWPRLISAFEATQIANQVPRVLDAAIDRNCVERDIDCTPMPPGTIESEANRNTTEAELRLKATSFVNDARTAAAATINALEQTAKLLAKLPGRKTVVLMTEGTFSDEAAQRARTIVTRASEAGIVIYTVNPRGLSAKMSGIPGEAPNEVGTDILSGLADDVPNFMAVGTGGMFIRNENNLGRALQRIEDDTSTYYVLGYAAPPASGRDEFRRIRVTIKRKGLDVRARHGYVAQRAGTMRASSSPGPGAASSAATPVDLAAPIPTIPRGDVIARVRHLDVVLRGAEVTRGTIVSVPASAPSTATRVRPDASTRVRELAGTDTAAATDAAQIGWAAYERGDVEGAVPHLEKAAADPHAKPWVLYALGLSQAALGRPADAIASWERVRQAAPAFAPVYIDLAATHSHMANLGEALAVLRAAQERWPNDPEIRNGIGVIYVRRGALDNAIETFSEAVRVAPQDALAYFNLAKAHEMRYARSGRFVTSQKRWVMQDADRERAIQYYQSYVRLGGPYLNAAKEALLTLQWVNR